MRVLQALVALLILAAGRAEAGWLPAGEPLTEDFARQLVVEALRADAEGERFEVTIDRPRLPLGNPGTADTEITLDDLRYEPQSGRFRAILVGMVEEGERFRLRLHGRAPALIRLPVLSRAVAIGEVIGTADLDWRLVPAPRVSEGTATVAEQVIGSEARRPLRPRRALAASDLIPPRLVRRGRPVRLIYTRPGLHLSAIGTARDDGALGDVVGVTNPDGHRRLQGVVSGPDEVTVGGPPGAPS